MAVAFTQLAAGSADTSQATSYAGNAGTPASGDLLIAFVVATGTVAAGSMTGGGFTWNRLTSFTKNAGADTLYIFWAIATSATSTTPTFDCTGDQATGACIYVLRVTGDSAYLRPYFRQVKTNTGSTANPSVTMNQAILTGSGVCGMCANGTNSSTQFTAPTNWTENSEVTYITPSTAMEVASRASGETGSTVTWTNANTSAWGAIVLEIAVDGSVDFGETNEEESKPLRKRANTPIAEALNNLLEGVFQATKPFFGATHSVLSPKKKLPAGEVVPNLLTSTLGSDAGNLQVRQHPLYPKLKKRKQHPPVEIIPNLLGTTLTPPVEVVVPRVHTLPTKLKKRLAKQEDEFVNLLTTTMAPVVVNVPRQHQVPPATKKRKTKQEEEPPSLLGLNVVEYQHRLALITKPTKKRLTKQEEEPPSLLLTLFADTPVVVTVPRLHTLPTPLRKRVTKQMEEVRNLLTTTLAVDTTEYIQRLALIGQKLTPRKGKGQEEPQNLLTTTLTPGTPVMPRVHPLIKKLPKRKGKQADETYNLLTSTLGVVPTTNPFPTQDQETPKTRRRTKVNTEGQNFLTGTGSLPVANPFPVQDQSVKKARRRKAVDPEIPNLLTSTLGVTYEYRPTLIGLKYLRRRAKVNDETQNNLPLQGGGVQPSPFTLNLPEQILRKRTTPQAQEFINYTALTTPPGVPYFSAKLEVERTARRQRGRYTTPGESLGVPGPLLPIPPPPAGGDTWVGVSLHDVWRRGGE